MRLKNTFIILLIFLYSNYIRAQMIINPVVNYKTHPTLKVEKIIKNANETIFFMSIMNELEQGGAFCVDKDVFISIPDKRIKFNIIKSEGIENCPDYHKFNTVGETVNFKLYFPAISDTIKELDLVENCNENCFTIRGIILDETINKEMHDFDTGVLHYRNRDYDVALSYFKEIVEKSKNTSSKYYAYSMYILPVIYFNKGEKELAKKAYENLLKSNISDKDYFIDKIKEINFFKSN